VVVLSVTFEASALWCGLDQAAWMVLPKTSRSAIALISVPGSCEIGSVRRAA
jgi:hypothetical protein